LVAVLSKRVVVKRRICTDGEEKELIT